MTSKSLQSLDNALDALPERPLVVAVGATAMERQTLRQVRSITSVCVESVGQALAVGRAMRVDAFLLGGAVAPSCGALDELCSSQPSGRVLALVMTEGDPELWVQSGADVALRPPRDRVEFEHRLNAALRQGARALRGDEPS